MKIKVKQIKQEKKCPNCNWETSNFYKLDGWENDWLCANCFVEELLESEAEYEIIPKFIKRKLVK